MRLDELQASALRIRDLYDELNQNERGRTWTREEFMLVSPATSATWPNS